jgi:hypothetical protein
MLAIDWLSCGGRRIAQFDFCNARVVFWLALYSLTVGRAKIWGAGVVGR